MWRLLDPRINARIHYIYRFQGIAIYLLYSNMQELPPEIHEIWMWTVIYIFIIEIFILDFIIIMVKMCMQPLLQNHYEKKYSNEICNNIFIMIWDIKMQR
jgi:hypothetical protein